MSDNDTNDQLVLICGYSANGKSASLRNIRNQDKWYYLSCEAGKKLPFRNKFQFLKVSDPYQVYEAFDHGKDDPNCEGIIIDSLTFLMDMFEAQYVRTAPNTMRGWSDYGDYFRNLMQSKVVTFNKPVIFIAHVKDILDEKTMDMKTMVPIKGSLAGQGAEAFFSTVVAAKKIPLKELEGFKSDLLTITDEEKELGFKYVFQTRITSKTTGERIRSPMGLFSKQETYIDNDAQILLDHLNDFYKE